MPSLNWAGFYSMVVLAGLASNPGRSLAEPQKEEMKNEPITLFASVDQKTTSIGDFACVPLVAASTVSKLDLNRKSVLVLQRVRSLGHAGGPYAVYIATAGASRPTEKNRIGEFSLYSVRQRTDSQELSFEVKSTFLKRLLGYQPASAHLQICVEDRSPTRASDHSPSLSFDKALLLQLQHD